MNKSLKGIRICLIIIFISIGILSGCSNKLATNNNSNYTISEKGKFTSITPKEAKQRLDSEKGIILLDVRTKEEYDSGHIKGSMLIPVDSLEQEANNKLSDKEVPIFVYCRSGNRSVTAANILSKLGYKNVYNLGGIRDWPYEVVK